MKKLKLQVHPIRIRNLFILELKFIIYIPNITVFQCRTFVPRRTVDMHIDERFRRGV